MPADGVLHVGERDYALVASEPGTWQITEVQIGELRGTNVEVLSGLKAGDRVLGKGAILLKPVVVLALQGNGLRLHRMREGGHCTVPGGKRPMNLVIEAALRLRWVVLLLTLASSPGASGRSGSSRSTPIPDISSQMVQIITVFPGRAPEEVERQVTIPVENAMLGVPRVENGALADHLRPVARADDLRGRDRRLLGPATGHGKARRHRLARRRHSRNSDPTPPPTAKSTATSWSPTARTT